DPRLLSCPSSFTSRVPPPPGSTLFPYTTLFRSWCCSEPSLLGPSPQFTAPTLRKQESCVHIRPVQQHIRLAVEDHRPGRRSSPRSRSSGFTTSRTHVCPRGRQSLGRGRPRSRSESGIAAGGDPMVHRGHRGRRGMVVEGRSTLGRGGPSSGHPCPGRDRRPGTPAPPRPAGTDHGLPPSARRTL